VYRCVDAGTIHGSQPIDMFAYDHKTHETLKVQLTPMMMTLMLLLLQLLLLLSTKHQPHCCEVLDRLPLVEGVLLASRGTTYAA
jgi:hypothetical protein